MKLPCEIAHAFHSCFDIKKNETIFNEVPTNKKDGPTHTYVFTVNLKLKKTRDFNSVVKTLEKIQAYHNDIHAKLGKKTKLSDSRIA